MTVNPQPTLPPAPNLHIDRPIEGAADDTLERANSAEKFARNVLSLDSSHGLVVGVLGPWGSGKTSYINLARNTFRAGDAQVVDFNPWMFSGIDRLVDAFFGEISAELKLLPQLSEAGKQLEEYGELLSGLGWVPIVGAWTERARIAMRLIGGGLKKSKGGTTARRHQVERALSKLTKPLIVILDDIDRLTTQDIRQVFQLVRLTASFPNVVYVLAFDRLRVEHALTEDGVPGRAYLEKILQLAIDLPVVSGEVLQSKIFEALDVALTPIDNVGKLDQDVWPNLFFNIIRPLLGSMRDVSRYALAVRSTAAALEGQIALADVLALEAVRIFMPDFFALLPTSIDAVTSVRDGVSDGKSNQHHKGLVDGLCRSAGDRGDVARAVLKELFPASRRYIDNYHYGYDSKAQWLRNRRVAHESLLRLYLERVPSLALRAHLAAEHAFEILADRNALDQFLRSVPHNLIEDVISGLEVFEDEYRPEHVVPGVITLLNFMPDIPERPRGMFDFGSGLKVTRVTYRLLRSLKEPVDIERAVRLILPELKHPSLQWEVISDVGHREGAGHHLIGEHTAAALESEWRERVRNAAAGQLEADPDLLSVFLFAQQNVAEGEVILTVPDDASITRKLLRNARSDTLSQYADSYAVRREPRLAWEALVRVFGGEAVLAERIDRLLSSAEAVDPALEELMRKYRNGWRPRDT
jgi:hypothetical protein